MNVFCHKLGVSVAAALIGFAGHLKSAEDWRPRIHFTPERNWINDPNGLVYYDGEYHLFFQHNPFGGRWGHMSWGHAVSRDLLHWEELDVALAEEDGVMIFSGSAVVDWKNTSGFGTNGKPPLVAIYTGHYTNTPLQNQHIAYSNDRGRTWTKYAGNPVIDIGERDFRDPKVFWHETTKRWIMVVAWPTHHKVRLYASPNLKEWQHLSDFGPAGARKEIWECPDLFPLPIEGSREKKWVLIVNTFGAPAGGSGCQYFVGDFDGSKFHLETNSHPAKPEFVPEGWVLADFEDGNYGEWRSTGTALGNQPAQGTLAHQQPVGGFRGRGLVNTFIAGDQPEGTLTSPTFEITHNHINFLIGGGNHPGKACLNLLIDGAIVRTATGADSEWLSWKSWDVRELRGKQATLQIVDRATGGWGHINVDHILLSDEEARPAHDGALWADFGPDFYAAVSWSDIPVRDGRRLWLGWMSNWQYAGEVPTAPWRNAMSLPRELTLRHTEAGLRLVHKPVREIEKARREHHRCRAKALSDVNAWLDKLGDLGDSFELNVDLAARGSSSFGLVIECGKNSEIQLMMDPASRSFSLDRSKSGRTDFHPTFVRPIIAPLPMEKDRVQLRIVVDRCSVEVFSGGGEVSVTSLMFPPVGERRARFLHSASESGITCRRLEVWRLE